MQPPSGMDPVVYRPAAFEDAISEIDTAIERLETRMGDRIARANGMLGRWTGMTASRFAGDYTNRLFAIHHDVLGELRNTRRNLLATLGTIEHENAARARARDQWWQEQQQAREPR